MTESKLLERIDIMEKMVRNIRIAVIVIAAFFLYETISPSGLFGQDRFQVINKLKVKELVIIDEQHKEWARIATGDETAQLILDDKGGNRLQISDGAISIRVPSESGHLERVSIDKNGIKVYGRDGMPLKSVP